MKKDLLQALSTLIDEIGAEKTRNNHYVPQWYQKGFLGAASQLYYLDLDPEKKVLYDGRVITQHDCRTRSTSKCFFERDLYSTFFGFYVSDEIERKLFGKIDDTGSKAVRAFIGGDESACHNHFFDFFSYIDTQKIRTPKGLSWIRGHYPKLNQLELMIEMQAIRNIHCTIWTEGVREIVSAKKANLKFILSDHPVTVYNYACPPDSMDCKYPNDPSIALKATQTIFPLDMDHCLILTNYEYAKNPDLEDPTSKRTNAQNFRNSMVRTDAFIRSRSLNDEEVRKINFIIKRRARRYIAAASKDWLYPERPYEFTWKELKETLLPPENGMFHFGGEMYVSYEDGSTYYQDAFGRTTPENPHLKKSQKKGEPRANDFCQCGSGKKYKKCCKDKPLAQRPISDMMSIRERNLSFCRGIGNILGLSKGKTWDDVRKELSNEQVANIHELFGFLWPVDTDIASLLPKPDGTLRALYTGVIDPRIISKFATSVAIYFDEIIIQNPFLNPASVKPDFSPVKNPHQYKQQTLKNVILLLMLEPYIHAGFINFIPDPCVFNGHLQRQFMEMAETRRQGLEIHPKEKKHFEELSKDDFQRTIWALPEEQQRRQILKIYPNFSEERIARLLQNIKETRNEDQLTLLQDDLYGKGKGGQMTMMTLAPNFELALYIAQITGAFIFTDSPTRWEEISQAQHKNKGVVIYNWGELSDCINSLQYPLNVNPMTTFSLREEGRLGKIRKVLTDIYSAIQSKEDATGIQAITDRLKHELIKAHETAQREMRPPKKSKENGTEEIEQHTFNARLKCLIPAGGITHNNVQRMLLSCGLSNYLKNVPMAIFLDND